jgi:hypothetical protein
MNKTTNKTKKLSSTENFHLDSSKLFNSNSEDYHQKNYVRKREKKKSYYKNEKRYLEVKTKPSTKNVKNQNKNCVKSSLRD